MKRTPLRRRTALGPKPRAKGNRGELAVRDILRAAGWPSCRRNFQSGGQGGGDLVDGPEGYHLEVKHQETCRLRAWLDQAVLDAGPGHTPVVVMRDNAHDWHAVLPHDQVIALATEHLAELCGRHYTDRARWDVWKWIEEAEAGRDRLGALEAIPCVVISRPGGRRWATVPLDALIAWIK